MISIYNLKPKFQKLLQPLLFLLKKLNVTPNQTQEANTSDSTQLPGDVLESALKRKKLKHTICIADQRRNLISGVK